MRFCVLTIMLFGISMINHAAAKPSQVTIEERSGEYRLLRNGRAYSLKGAGGYGSLETLKEAGGNSVRTWGVHKTTGQILDYADRLGITVAQGLWMAPARSFDYRDKKKVDKQLERILGEVKLYKEHPALLVWGVGNEVELGAGDSIEFWIEINRAAKAIKAIDPNHPTMIVVADLGKNARNITLIKKYCPDIDIIGVNSYGGAMTLSQRYLDSTPDRPMILTEYGAIKKGDAPGGRPIEMTSGEKSTHLVNVMQSGLTDNPYYLGAYTFLWGSKREVTETFFGLFLDDGSRTQLVETQENLWRRKSRRNCPSIDSIAPLYLSTQPLQVFDVEYAFNYRKSHKRLEASWAVKREIRQTYGGAEAPRMEAMEFQVLDNTVGHARLEAPRHTGVYRVYLTLTDDKGCAATANLPLEVRREKTVKIE
jgi:Glycosyl hydrolases family 2, TIM barrel domain